MRRCVVFILSVAARSESHGEDCDEDVFDVHNIYILFLQCVVLFVADRLQPFVAVAGLGVGVVGEVLHPAVLGGSVPMFHALGHGDGNARFQLHSGFAPFLIPAATAHADQHLHCTMVNMPVVAAARLEADVAESACGVEDGEVAVAYEILGVCRIRFADWPG